MRAVFLAALLGFASAPLQCGSSELEEGARETPPEALYDLSQHFGKAGNDKAREATLKYLIERYPNSRFAERAKNELARAHEGSAAP